MTIEKPTGLLTRLTQSWFPMVLVALGVATYVLGTLYGRKVAGIEPPVGTPIEQLIEHDRELLYTHGSSSSAPSASAWDCSGSSSR